MPLHDAVGINSKNVGTTEYQGADVKYMGKGLYIDDCVCYLTWHNYPSSVEGESHGIIIILLYNFWSYLSKPQEWLKSLFPQDMMQN